MYLYNVDLNNSFALVILHTVEYVHEPGTLERIAYVSGAQKMTGQLVNRLN